MNADQNPTTEELSGEIMIFFRKECWYPIEAVRGKSLGQQAEDNAVLNPGTLRVEDAEGNVLWSLQ